MRVDASVTAMLALYINGSNAYTHLQLYCVTLDACPNDSLRIIGGTRPLLSLIGEYCYTLRSLLSLLLVSYKHHS
jgi:hypothetical protein